LSEAILDEVVEALDRKFRWPTARLDVVRKTLLIITESVTPFVILDVVKDDPDDNQILECAQSGALCLRRDKEMETCFGLASTTA
jgi:hypothetical protein